jgi:uncharacterized protein affecting Mg2+/Co2+ transport
MDITNQRVSESSSSSSSSASNKKLRPTSVRGDFLFNTIPSTVVCCGVCSFLTLDDIFSFRATSLPIKNMLHNSDGLWKYVLQRDFGLVEEEHYQDGVVWAVDLVPPPPPPPGKRNNDRNIPLLAVESKFEAVKIWKRSSCYYYRGWEEDKDDIAPLTPRSTNHVTLAMRSGRQPCLYGPYFIRAAKFWQAFFSWCDDGGAPHVASKDVGTFDAEEDKRTRQEIRDSVGSRGCTNRDFPLTCRYLQGCFAGQACLALGGIQSTATGYYHGMFGHYGSYGYECSSFWTGVHVPRILRLPIVIDLSGLERFSVDLESGELTTPIIVNDDRRFGQRDYPAVARVNSKGNRDDDALRWMEEYVRRLSEGEIGIGRIGNRRCITLYPRYVPGAAPRLVNGVPVVSRKVTRGVEVIASSVFASQRAMDICFIYSLRIRLLVPDDGQEYLSPERRGFQTCQLKGRHWKITNYETGQTHQVHGEGVIGLFPELEEGSYIEDGTRFPGTFEYQSCTGPMNDGGCFGGHLTFQTDSGEYFNVEVGKFALDRRPDFLY